MNNKLSNEEVNIYKKFLDDSKCSRTHLTSPREIIVLDKALTELLAYREAESKPVAFTDADEIAFRDFGCGDLWEKPHGFGRDIPLYTSPVLGQTTELDIEAIMNKVQEYASAWACVGGPFDSGVALIDAKNSKDELRKMLLEAK